MVTFNELRIADDRECLIIDVEVERVDIFKNMYIDSIYLEYYKNATPTGVPGEKAVLIWENTNSDKSSTKAVRLYYPKRFKQNDMTKMGVTTFDNGLFYVIVNLGGDPDYSKIAYMPCGTEIPRRIGAILDWKAFYTRGMQYVNSLFNGCNPCPDLTGFEHFAVLWNALKMALSTCDWNLVSDLWDKFLLAPADVTVSGSITPKSSGCGCR